MRGAMALSVDDPASPSSGAGDRFDWVTADGGLGDRLGLGTAGPGRLRYVALPALSERRRPGDRELLPEGRARPAQPSTAELETESEAERWICLFCAPSCGFRVEGVQELEDTPAILRRAARITLNFRT